MYEYREIKPALHNSSQLNQAIYVQAPQKKKNMWRLQCLYVLYIHLHQGI